MPMIKRLIGIAATAAILALLVLVVLRHGNYRSMLPSAGQRETALPAESAGTTGPAAPTIPAAEETLPADSAGTALTPTAADTVRTVPAAIPPAADSQASDHP